MSTYQEAFDAFSSNLEESPIEVSHSGTQGSTVTVSTVGEWLGWDEVEAEESWSNHLDALGLSQKLSLDDANDCCDWDEYDVKPVSSFMLTVNSFNNVAMSEDPDSAMIEILRKAIDDIQVKGLSNMDCDIIRDSNGNRVGDIEVEQE